MSIKNFYQLDAWKAGHQLALEVYSITNTFPKEEQYGMVSQLKRSSSSISANIAEGFARFHYNDKKRFYVQSRGSVAEVQNFLLLAKDLKYISGEECKKMGEKANEVGKLLNGLIKKMNELSSEYKK